MSILMMISVDFTACDIVGANIVEGPGVFIFEVEE
jgi:hypothetical protein